LAIAIIVTSVINEAFLSTFFLAHEIAHAVVLFLATLEPTFLQAQFIVRVAFIIVETFVSTIFLRCRIAQTVILDVTTAVLT
jgi:hypothetical protein